MGTNPSLTTAIDALEDLISSLRIAITSMKEGDNKIIISLLEQRYTDAKSLMESLKSIKATLDTN